MDAAALAAEGWRELPTANFSRAIGSTWAWGERGARKVGWLTDPATQNDHGGMVHGGAMMTFADIALGCAVADALVPGRPFVTVQLQYNFVAAAPPGGFVSCEPEVVRRTSQLVFVRGLIKAGERTVGSAEGIWKVLEPEKLERLKAG